MENFKNNENTTLDSHNPTTEELTRTAFEYSLPTNDDDITESNKSTPYFTPLDFLQGSFDFPSPNTDKLNQNKEAATSAGSVAGKLALDESAMELLQQNFDTENMKKISTPKIPVVTAKQVQSSSPVVTHKYKRFSLYERRSCSPQNLVLKHTTSVESKMETDGFVANKENTIPKFKDKYEENIYKCNSGNNSPLIDENGSPKIHSMHETAMLGNNRLSFSPKLLSSINNLSIGGSPLGVISSAGYKNGNYFKFPEIDQVVQEQGMEIDENGTCRDNQLRAKQNYANRKSKFKSPSIEMDNINDTENTGNKNINLESNSDDLVKSKHTENIKQTSTLHKTDSRKNRKNKNNLTIKITDIPSNQATQPSSPSPKPKTPTIKSTKEKALSLDSAAAAVNESELRIVVSGGSQTYINEFETKPLKIGSGHLRCSGERLRPEINIQNTTNRSTSLSQLPAYGDAHNLYYSHHPEYFTGSNFSRSLRRRIPGSSELTPFHRKNLCIETTKKSLSDISNSEKLMSTVVILKEDDEVQVDESENKKIYQTHIQGTSNNSLTPNSLANVHRGLHKPNPILHASNTNLKTLPEFLTLVEFTSSPKSCDFPLKQKSMDLPTTLAQPQIVRTKNTNSSSSTNLLQRRGSNHSLTLNLSLHGSCSNLLGSCRTGLSASNYSLGSVGNSTTNLNSKSSYNLDQSVSSTPHPMNIQHTNSTTTQGARQSLFRRRGSNHSLTLNNLSATSCGNLKTFVSQNSLNVDRCQTHLTSGVTRTTSFITPTNNTPSNTTPKRGGLLERRGSNQSLTLNMSSSFGGIGGTERSLYLGDSCAAEPEIQIKLPSNCCAETHQRKFFSSENLNKGNKQFADLNQAHKRDANQVCYGSVSDLNPTAAHAQETKRDHFNFEESTVCTCTGVRNIMTRPLSPQTTSEEFKMYLANIQMLQNASNALSQIDLIKFNYLFDSSYTSNSKGMVEHQLPVLGAHHSSKETETPTSGLQSTSEDCEVATRYQDVISAISENIKPDDVEQKRLFRELHKEFWDLPLNHQEKPMVFGSQAKNRYKTILPNENSRFILEKELIPIPKDIDDAAVTDEPKLSYTTDEVPYINANYIKGPDYTSKGYVATQGPLPNTTFEFWLMIYQNTQKHIHVSDRTITTHTGVKENHILPQYFQKIVMLTNFLENNRQKCAVYFPVELNEIFITTNKQETVTPNKELQDFLRPFLNQNDELPYPSKTHLAEQSVCFESFETDLSDEIYAFLPRVANFFVIKNIGIVKKNGFSIRKFVILYCLNYHLPDYNVNRSKLLIQKFYSYHYWYPDWPDHRSPRDINTLVDMCLHLLNLGKCEAEFEIFCEDSVTPTQQIHIEPKQVALYQQDIFNSMQPFPVIHCSAGIGRTGCLTAILNGIRQLRQSLAYSLTSMAAAVTKEAALMQVLSPVDFSLPKYFIDAINESEDICQMSNDTDSNFTRNTLLYIKYILNYKEKDSKQLLKKDEQETTTGIRANICTGNELPSLSSLTKLPDIFVDILGIVCNLRLQRGGMVQNSEQYELIHRAICLYLKRTFALKRF